MHYIRFLKPPSLTQASRGTQDLQLTAKITITSDLGESFLCVNLPLLVNLVDASGHNSQVHPYHWKAGNRHLEISFRVALSAQGTRPGLRWPCRLFVQPRDANHRTDALAEVFKIPHGDKEPAAGVLPILSEQLHSTVTGKTSRTVQRLLKLDDRDDICIWEETGESIARHIWDAGLVLSAYIESLAKGIDQPHMPPFPPLQRLLSKQQLKVLELGSGCGIVGITLAKCFPKAKVLLTDLLEAEDIVRRNISIAETQSSKMPNLVRIEYQNLDWAEPLPNNIQSGDLDLVLVADCTYNPDVVPDLVKILADIVRYNKEVVILLATKVRHESEKVFFDMMARMHLMVVNKLLLPLPLLGQKAEEIDIYLFRGNLEQSIVH